MNETLKIRLRKLLALPSSYQKIIYLPEICPILYKG